MTTEQLFATTVGIIVASAFTTVVSGFVLWFFFSRKGVRRSDDLTPLPEAEGLGVGQPSIRDRANRPARSPA